MFSINLLISTTAGMLYPIAVGFYIARVSILKEISLCNNGFFDNKAKVFFWEIIIIALILSCS